MSHQLPPIDELVARALAEDLGVPAEGLLGGTAGAAVLARDVTTSSVVSEGERFSGRVVSRSSGVVCGLPCAQRVWTMLAETLGDSAIEVFPLVAEGAKVVPDQPVAEVEGLAWAILAGERTALNLLMTLSGIATEARRWQDEAGADLAVLDTRKTIPGMRTLSKYAVRVGGAFNHREGLFDMVLVKDNHIRHAGGITLAVEAAKAAHPDLAIEVEADSIEQAEEAVRAGADIVLLDNMDDAELTRANARVKQLADQVGTRTLCEASGGIVFGRLGALRETGVDRVSTSTLTLAPPLDFGLDEDND